MSIATQTTDGAVRAEQRYRVIYVAEAACATPDLCGGIELHARGREMEALLLAPAHDPRDAQWVVNNADALAGAEERLRESAACLNACGINCEARTSDHDPVQATADALAEFPADEIVMFTRPLKRSAWYHQNEIDRARRKFQQPIAHVVVGE